MYQQVEKDWILMLEWPRRNICLSSKISIQTISRLILEFPMPVSAGCCMEKNMKSNKGFSRRERNCCSLICRKITTTIASVSGVI